MKMKKNKIFLTTLLILIGLFFQKCQDVEVLSPIPRIEFISFEFEKEVDILGNAGLMGELRFYFIDGDGDIGFHEHTDTSKPEEKTVFIDKYIMENNEYVLQEQDPDSPEMTYRVPYFSTSGNNRTLEGEIIVSDINIPAPYGDFNSSVFDDTIMYKFYIKDRAGNMSNVDSTGCLVLRDFIRE